MEEGGKRADFFEVAGQGATRELCLRVKGYYLGGERVYVLAQSPELAQRVNDELWTFEEDSFIPHTLCPISGEVDEPVAVGVAAVNPNRAERLVVAGNPAQETVLKAAGFFNLVTDFVPKGDESATASARLRYKLLRENGFDMAHHPMGGARR